MKVLRVLEGVSYWVIENGHCRCHALLDPLVSSAFAYTGALRA
jgi:hypothetical protein